jgi:phosphopantothenoylcysteine decarboxylase/phosphopantothenate--cysteine ligase
MSAQRREIILGVGGGIAAYKSCDLLRRLQDAGFSVTVVPTPSSLNFVGRATWEALSGRAVSSSVFEMVDQIRHISLAKDSEAILISPATADLIARIAAGRADDLLTNLVLATERPILIVPAMHPSMWSNPATVANIATLRARGIFVLEPVEGALTSGDVGRGRLPETSAIIDYFSNQVLAPRDLAGKKVLVTAGGTREPIDPVRFIGNRSSGKQGIAIAEAAFARGADVTLIAANCEIESSMQINRVNVETAEQMLEAMQSKFEGSDFLFMSAAVADARVRNVSSEKIKKGELAAIELEINPDLLATTTSTKSKQIVVAFAAETASHSHEEARIKMARKGADLIYLNDVSGGAIFGSESTSGTILTKTGSRDFSEPISKVALAHALIDEALKSGNK